MLHTQKIQFNNLLLFIVCFLSGCSEQPSSSKDICNNGYSKNDLMQSTWHEAKTAFDQFASKNHHKGRSLTSFPQYLKGYRQGINDARRAYPYQIPSPSFTSDLTFGYIDGYQSILQYTRIHLIDGYKTKPTTQFQELTEQAIASFENTSYDKYNPFLKNAYLSGYLAAWASILSSLHTTFHLFSKLNTGSKLMLELNKPTSEQNETQHAFYHGYLAGKESANSKIEKTIRQVIGNFLKGNSLLQ